MSASEAMPWPGWAISTCGSDCIEAITALAGACTAARFSTMKLFDPTPMSMAPVAKSWGTLTAGPPWMIRTSSPRFLYSPSASAS